MKFKVQVVTLSDDGEEAVREVACVERAELTPASLGLAIAESKTILQGIQEGPPVASGQKLAVAATSLCSQGT